MSIHSEVDLLRKIPLFANIDTAAMPKVTVVKTEPPATSPPKPEPKGVPESNAGLPKEAFETAARAYKAEAAANLLHSSGISIDDAAKMNTEQWDMLAKAVDANDPKGWKGPVELKTAKTQAEVIEQLAVEDLGERVAGVDVAISRDVKNDRLGRDLFLDGSE